MGRLLLCLCPVIQGCPPAETASGSGGKAAVAPASPSAAGPDASVTSVRRVTPVSYLGATSFGGTIAIHTHTPAPGKVTVRFVDSPFGLAGSVVGNVSVTNGRHTITGLVPDGATPPPPHVSAALRAVRLGFRVSGTLLSGEIANLPRSEHGGTGTLAGVIHATSVDVLPPLASIAGVYAFIATNVDLRTSDHGEVPRSVASFSGQVRLDADGRLRVCAAQNYRDGCVDPRSGKPAPGAHLHPADQTRYPGVYALRADGEYAGRLFVARDGERLTLLIDQRQGYGPEETIGAWILHSARSVAAADLDGDWQCRQPPADFDALASVARDGGMATHPLWIDDQAATTGSTPAIFGQLERDGSAGVGDEERPVRIEGLAHIRWLYPEAVPDGDIREQVLLPLDAQRLAYVNARRVSAHPAPASRANVDEVVWGFCVKGDGIGVVGDQFAVI